MHHTEMLDERFYKDMINDRFETNFQEVHEMNQKILRHPSALACWYRGGIPDPITAELHPTNKCDNKCTYCHYRNLHDKPASLSLQQLNSILDQLAENNCKSIIFSGGGEPLLNVHTIEAMKRARSNGMEIGLITNGQLIEQTIARELVCICTWIRVSLSATTKETFIKIRGIDKFDKAKNGITQLCLAKMLKQSDCTIGVQWINTRLEPISNLAIFIKNWLSKRPIDYLQIIAEQSYDKAVLLRQATLQHTVKTLQNRFHGKVNIIQAKADDLTKENFGRTYTECHGHNFVPMIGADNKMYICCHLLGSENALIGDLNKQSFQQIWYTQKRFKTARAIDVSKCMPLCKHHEINKFLHQIKQPMQHHNFL